MTTYILCGPLSESFRKLLGLAYTILEHEFPSPDEEYSIKILSDWALSDLATHSSLADFLLNAKYVEIWDLRTILHFYKDKEIVSCSHIRALPDNSIIRSGDKYLFLCEDCTAIYSINGLPPIDEFDRIDSNFPRQLSGE